MMKAAKVFKPQIIVILGDFIDCFAISTYSKDPSRALGLTKEVSITLKKLDELNSLGAKQKYTSKVIMKTDSRDIYKTKLLSYSTLLI